MLISLPFRCSNLYFVYFQTYTATGFDTYHSTYQVSATYKIEMSIWDTSGENFTLATKSICFPMILFSDQTYCQDKLLLNYLMLCAVIEYIKASFNIHLWFNKLSRTFKTNFISPITRILM